MSNPYAEKAATDQLLLKRSCESLLGITADLLADGHLSDQESAFLDIGLQENEELRSS